VANAAIAQDILTLPPPKTDARIQYGDDPNRFGDLRAPKGSGPHPVVNFIHGGSWLGAYDLAHAGHLCAALTAEGFATWSLEYRAIGQPGGGSQVQRYKWSSPMELLPMAVPQRVIHGEQDDIVPFDLSLAFAKASKNAKLIAIPNAGHFKLIEPRSAAWPTVLQNITT